MNTCTSRRIGSGTTRPPSLTGRTARGCSARFSSRRVDRAISRWRTTLGPPAADPAHPPMNISRNSTIFGLVAPQLKVDAGEAGGRENRHHLKRAVANARRATPMPSRDQEGRQRQPTANEDDAGIGAELLVARSAPGGRRTARYCSAKLAPAMNMNTVMIQSIAALS